MKTNSTSSATGTETPTSRITSNCMYGCSIPRNGQTLITLQRVKAIRNDNKCVKIVAEKFLDKEKPRIEFELCRV